MGGKRGRDWGVFRGGFRSCHLWGLDGAGRRVGFGMRKGKRGEEERGKGHGVVVSRVQRRRY